MPLETHGSRDTEKIYTDVLTEARNSCYKARDSFYACVEKESTKKPTEIASVGLLYPVECKNSREDFVKMCRPTWVPEVKRKFHLMNWNNVCCLKVSGGVGVRKLTVVNKALLGKWLWRFGKENDSLWKDVIVRKYGSKEMGWWPTLYKAMGLWKAIVELVGRFRECVSFSVGDGQLVKFWEDTWLGSWLLKDLFPALASLFASEYLGGKPFRLFRSCGCMDSLLQKKSKGGS